MAGSSTYNLPEALVMPVARTQRIAVAAPYETIAALRQHNRTRKRQIDMPFDMFQLGIELGDHQWMRKRKVEWSWK